MTEPYSAVIRARTVDFKHLIEEVALARLSEPHHTKLYLEIHADRLDTLAFDGPAIYSYCTYTAEYFEALEFYEELPVRAVIDLSILR